MSNLASAALALQQSAQNTQPTPQPVNTYNSTNSWEEVHRQHRLLGQQFLKARNSLYMTQHEVACKANLSRRTISRIEQNGYAKTDTLMQVASVLGYELLLQKQAQSNN